MSKVILSSVTGSTPISVYIADYYGNNRQFLGEISGSTIYPVPPQIFYYPSSIFDTAPSIMLILVDLNGCETFKIIECAARIIAIRTETYIAIATESGNILIP